MEYVNNMVHIMSDWLNDPTVVKIMVMILGLFVLYHVTRIAQRQLERYIRTPESIYPMKKVTTVLAYIIAFIYITSIFRDKLGGLTLAFGVAGAGIAFALQGNRGAALLFSCISGRFMV